jgi:hypothetical protein
VSDVQAQCEGGIDVKENRRDFIKTSLAISVLTVSKIATESTAQAAPTKKKIALVVSTRQKNNHEAAFAQALSNLQSPQL